MEVKKGVSAVIVLLFVLFLIFLFYNSQRSKAFQLGNEDAILSDYVNEVLQPGYIPEELVVQHKRSSSGTLTGTNYTYGAGWTIGDVQFHAFLHYNPELTRLDDLSVLIDFQKRLEFDEVAARRLLTKYFRSVGDVKCGDLGNMYICEYFVPGEDKNQGFAAITLYEAERTVLYSCVYFKGSEMFEWNSCVKRK
jgi:hypothetical protein